ncbi:U3 small nucleolar RNA-associated protein 14 homolog A isoform X1 [Bufo bufo]|uniref:U3 small nucleolar RNA-associated protein 14 homolog A isoform X1 n=1 Tax=Bufo bufo TaxID=8384 RepID=UPI001ABEC21D|nr:U3 small nucleolar RNA-associated protein 14 homolog A isoform X1 [Bufo bufo]
MSPARKRGRSLQTPITMEEEGLFVTEPPVSASEDEEDSDAERRHRKLLDAISALDGKKRKKLSERTEAGLQVSEFGISAEGAGEKINLTDLIDSVKKVTPLSSVKKQLTKLKETRSVELPLSKEETQKIQRVVSYKRTSEEISKWDNVVKENRGAERLVFPLNDQPLKPAPIEDTMSGWKASTPLEMEIFSILHKNKQPITDPLLTPMEEASLKAMSLGEAKRRRAELQKARALQSYYEAKARREKKIKSKKYHRLLKKVRQKEVLKKFEELRKFNPDAALEELEKLEKARMRERMSLKHQNKGKWAKSKAIIAKYDEGARRAMQEQLQKNKELTRKVVVVSEDEEEKVEEIIPDFVNEAQMSLEGANPWMTGKLRNDAKDPETQEETQVEEEVNAKTDEQEEEEEEEESEEEALLHEFEGRRRLRKELGPEPGTVADSAAEDGAREVSQFNTLFQRLLDQNKKEEQAQENMAAEEEEEEPVTAEEQVEQDRTEEEEEGPVLLESLERNRTLEDLAALGEQELLDEGITPRDRTPKKLAEKTSQPTGKKRSKKSKLIDSKDILPTKARPVQAPLLPTTVEAEEEMDDDAETSQKLIIQEAFAGDDVIGDFLKEKRDAAKAAKPKDLSLVLPGWGEWGGTDLKVSRKKRRKFIIKAPPAPPRKDERLSNVIINEKRNILAAAHQVNELPFPFNSRKHFESSIRAPVGSTWNTERAVQKLTTPRVITMQGHIIEPITEDVFQKHSATKKAAIEVEEPKPQPNQPPPKRPKSKKITKKKKK